MILDLILEVPFLQSVEFYVICAVVAAAVVAMAVKPADRRAVITHLLSGQLEPDDSEGEPRIELTVGDDSKVRLVRYGVDYVGLEGAVSAAVSVNAFDVTVKERLVPGREGLAQRVKATFVLDFFGPERYHLRYEGEPELMAVLTLAVRPGVSLTRQLVR